MKLRDDDKIPEHPYAYDPVTGAPIPLTTIEPTRPALPLKVILARIIYAGIPIGGLLGGYIWLWLTTPADVMLKATGMVIAAIAILLIWFWAPQHAKLQ